MALDGEFVLILPGDAPFVRDVFRGDAHVHLIERVGESRNEDVDRSGIVEARAPAHGGQPVGSAAHGFSAAADGGIGVAVDDGVSGGEDGLQAAAAKTIKSEGRRFDRHSTAQSGDAGEINVFGIGVDDVSKHDMTDVGWRQARALQALAHNFGCEFGGRDIFQCAAELANGSAHGAHDNDLSINHRPAPFHGFGDMRTKRMQTHSGLARGGIVS